MTDDTSGGREKARDLAPDATPLARWLDGRFARLEWRELRDLLAALAREMRDVAASGEPRLSSALPVLAVANVEGGFRLTTLEPSAAGCDAPLWQVAPEIRGGGQASEASDVFMLAAAAYAMAVGRPPDVIRPDAAPSFERSARNLAAQDYPAQLLSAIDASLDPDPAARPPLGHWLDRGLATTEPTILAARPVRAAMASDSTAPQAPAEQPGPRETSPLRQLAIAAGVAAVVILAGGGYLLTRLSGSVQAPSSPAPPAPAEIAAAPAQVASPVPAPPPPVAAAPAPEPARPRSTSPYIRDCPECPELTLVAGGTVAMTLTPPGAARPVTAAFDIPRGFAAGRFEVTRAEFAAFNAAANHQASGGCHARRPEWRLDAALDWRQPGFAQGDDHPVVCVSLADARAYVGWLSIRTGRAYRLLTDPEWHHLASLGETPGVLPVQTQCSYANIADEAFRAGDPAAAAAACRDGFRFTAPVGSLLLTGPGFGDLYGNVWEWVDSCAPTLAEGRPVFGGCASDAPRILRGGSFSDRPEMATRDARLLSPPGVRDQIAGFRVAREIEACDVAGAPCPLAAGSTSAPPPSRAGDVERVRGSASAVQAGEERLLEADGAVFVQDTVRTGPDGRASLRLGDRTILRLGEKANVTINRYVIDAGGVIDIGGGAIEFQRSGAPSPTPLNFRSPYGLIAVRGTRFIAGVSAGLYGIFVETGEVAVSGPGKTVMVGAGQGTNFAAPGAEPSNPAVWGEARVREARDSVR